MSDNVENLILEHPRHIRGRVDILSDDMKDVKYRLTSLESQVAGLHGDLALIHGRIDRLETRFDRIERRLEISDVV